jgi:ABC-type dipeptide/oligopeptide/nickel transport system permease component
VLVYILRRLALLVPTLLGVLAVVFFVMAFAPGGFGGRELTAEGAQTEGLDARRVRLRIERRYGLDLPLIAQFGRWLNQVSPIGFRMSSDIEFSDTERDAAAELLSDLPLNTRPRNLERAVTAAVEIARYRAETPTESAQRLREALSDPIGAMHLFDLMDVSLDEHTELLLVARLQGLLDRDDGLARAQNTLIEELAFEASGRSRIRFDRPAIKAPDLGESLRGRRVADLLMERLPVSVLLNVLSIPIVYVVAIVAGLYAARHRGSAIDYGTGFIFVALWSVPVIWAGVMLITYLASEQHLRWFPTTGLNSLRADQMAFMPTGDAFVATAGFTVHVMASITAWTLWYVQWLVLAWGVTMLIRLAVRRKTAPDRGLWEIARGPFRTWAIVMAAVVGGYWLAAIVAGVGVLPTRMPGEDRGWLLDYIWHLVLPVACLTYTGFAVMSKVMRGSILDAMSADYVRTARAKGVPEQQVLWRHTFRNALLPLITMLSGILPGLFAGTVVIETIFAINGLGRLGVQAAFEKDRELVMAVTLIGALLGLTAELIRDVCYAIADPRVSYE